MKPRLQDRKKAIVAGLLITGVALATAHIIIDGRKPPFSTLPNVQGTSVNSMWEIRNAGLTQAAGAYGFSFFGKNHTFKMIWPDGSSERAIVAEFSSAGVRPIPGTQIPPSTFLSGCPGCHSRWGGGGGLSGEFSGGGLPNGTVTVGPLSPSW